MSHTKTYSTLFDNDGPGYRCSELIRRCAPRFMRIGGGALVQDALPHDQRIKSVTPRQAQEVQRLLREGKLRQFEVARATHTTQQYVCKAKIKMKAETFAATITGSNERKGSEMPAEGKRTVSQPEPHPVGSGLGSPGRPIVPTTLRDTPANLSVEVAS